MRGNAKYRLTLYPEATDDYTDAINLKPDEPDYHYWLGMAKYDMKQLDEAKESFSNAIDLKSDNGSYYRMKGHACYMAEEYEEAIDCFDRAINLESNRSADTYYWRGAAKYDDSRYLDAIDDFTLAINLSPQDPKFYRARGMTKRQIENFEEANDDLQTALKFAEEIKDVTLIDQINRELRRFGGVQVTPRKGYAG